LILLKSPANLRNIYIFCKATFEDSFSAVFIQGDQMSLLKKITQNVALPVFRQNQNITFTEEKGCQRIWATSVFFKKTAQGKQSPNT
jgi:hypothetical protein